MLSCTNAPLSPPTTQIQEPFRIISSTKYALSENDALKEVQAVINMLDPTTRADKKTEVSLQSTKSVARRQELTERQRTILLITS